MSYAHGTPHFNLPLTQGSDKRDWADTNQAFEDIDAATYQAGSDAAGALSAAQSAQSTANSAATDAANAVTTANSASSSAASAAETAALARTEAQSAVSTANSASSTAQNAATLASNADTVALAAQANIGTMSSLNTQDKTSLVAAINEVLGQIGGGMPELDFNNAIDITTSGIVTSKKGAAIVVGRSNNTSTVYLTANSIKIGDVPATDISDVANICVHGIDTGTTLALTGAIATSASAKFVPYK